jgi:hypothetical protein
VGGTGLGRAWIEVRPEGGDLRIDRGRKEGVLERNEPVVAYRSFMVVILFTVSGGREREDRPRVGSDTMLHGVN